MAEMAEIRKFTPTTPDGVHFCIRPIGVCLQRFPSVFRHRRELVEAVAINASFLVLLLLQFLSGKEFCFLNVPRAKRHDSSLIPYSVCPLHLIFVTAPSLELFPRSAPSSVVFFLRIPLFSFFSSLNVALVAPVSLSMPSPFYPLPIGDSHLFSFSFPSSYIHSPGHNVFRVIKLNVRRLQKNGMRPAFSVCVRLLPSA